MEGFLFPDTYEFGPDATAESVLKTMVNRFLTVADEIDFADQVQADLGITPYEALIVASLAQAEAGNEADMPKVARVAYNRALQAEPELACPCLEFDVTTNYWLETIGEEPIHSGQMTRGAHDDPKNTYNTHDPAGPAARADQQPGQGGAGGGDGAGRRQWYLLRRAHRRWRVGVRRDVRRAPGEHPAGLRERVPLC